MPRPIVWALGTLALAAASATSAGDRIAARLGLGSRPAPIAVAATGATTTPPAAASTAPGVVTIAADLQGHFTVHPSLDGRRVRMLVDTGASLVVLSHQDAGLAGVRVEPRDFTRRVSTANGVVAAAPVRVREIRIGDITVRNVDALVMPPGRLGTSLLGMSFLKRLGGFEIAQGRLTLRG